MGCERRRLGRVRIAVIGAGAVGGTIAALMAAAGHDVSLVARGPQLEALHERGLSLTGAFGSAHAPITPVARLAETPELAFVCTKAQDARTAIEAQAEHLGGIPVVVVQNGVEGLAQASAQLADSEVLGGLAVFAASYLEPGSVTATASGPTFLGSGSGPASATALRVAALINTVMPCTAVANFTGAQWTKLIVNQVNALPAITGLSAQTCIRDAALGPILTAGMREAVRTGLASGIRFGSIMGLSHTALRLFAASPLTIGRVLPHGMAKQMGPVPNPGSTLQSIRRGQLTEVDFLNGAVVHAAAALGRRAPINATLTALVHQVETEGAFLSPAAVVDAVALSS
jgi:2-dehydropantoate 2-reductase